jgi:hypothetical protein
MPFERLLRSGDTFVPKTNLDKSDESIFHIFLVTNSGLVTNSNEFGHDFERVSSVIGLDNEVTVPRLSTQVIQKVIVGRLSDGREKRFSRRIRRGIIMGYAKDRGSASPRIGRRSKSEEVFTFL